VSPLLILGLVVAGVVVLAFLFGLTPDPSRKRSPAMLKRRSKWWRLIPVVPLVGAIGCLVVAFGGFRFSVLQTPPVALLVMDVSDSMEETDIQPSRIAAAQGAALSFLDELPSDFEVGLVTFAGDDDLVVSPTADHASVARAVNGFETSSGTHIWDGLATGLDAVDRRRAGDEAPAAVLLMSDGRDTGSAVERGDVTDRAVSLGVPVYTVLLGGEGGERPAQIEELEAVSGATGAETFTAETADQLTERFRSIGTRFSVELAADPNTTPLVIAAIVLVVLAGILLVLTQR
jgi:Ca-activated chloride channel family protein